MLHILEWKRTTTQYVAILQSLENFEPGSIRPLRKRGNETVLGGTLRGTTKLDWYALAYDRTELEGEEARDLARRTLDEYRAGGRIA